MSTDNDLCFLLATAKGKPAGSLDGLTVGVRDLFLTRGVHTPFGSPTTPTPYRTSII